MPDGVDMARMKIEVLAARLDAWHRLGKTHHRDPAALGALGLAAAAGGECARGWVPGLATLSERLLGLAADRPLPASRGMPSMTRNSARRMPRARSHPAARCLNRYFEPDNLRAAVARAARGGL